MPEIRLRHDTVTDLEVRTSGAGTVVELTLYNAGAGAALTSSDLPAPVADALRAWLDPIPTGRRAVNTRLERGRAEGRRAALLDVLDELDRRRQVTGAALVLDELREYVTGLLPAEAPDA